MAKRMQRSPRTSKYFARLKRNDMGLGCRNTIIRKQLNPKGPHHRPPIIPVNFPKCYTHHQNDFELISPKLHHNYTVLCTKKMRE
eukprot:5747075-Amphidinium_carterae.2